MCPNVSPMGCYVPLWGLLWVSLDPNVFLWVPMGFNVVPMCLYGVSYGSQLCPYVFLWVSLSPTVIHGIPMCPNVPLWVPVSPYGSLCVPKCRMSPLCVPLAPFGVSMGTLIGISGPKCLPMCIYGFQ